MGPTHRPGGEDANQHKYLTFRLGAECYAVPILRVREIIGMMAITPLPQAPAHVKGVMNLRGRIIPVIDLRARFGMPGVNATKETCVIVMDGGDGAEAPTGVIVDCVQEVQNIAAGSVSEPPSFGETVPLEYIRGLGKAGDKVVVVLQIERVLGCVRAEEGVVGA